MEGGISRQRVVWGAPSFWINLFPLYVGRSRGLFAERGIDLEIRYFHGGPELASAVRQGRVQIGNMGAPSFIKAFYDGLPAKIVGSAVTQKLDHYLVALPEIETLAGLRGKRIGILSPGSCDSYFIRRILEKESIDPEKEVLLTPLGSSYGDLDYLASKRVDAAFFVEPRVTLGENRKILRILTRVGDHFPRYQWGIIFAREGLIGESPLLVKNLLEGYRKASRFIKENPEECISPGARLFKMGRDLFCKALERSLPNWETETRIDQTGLENAVQIQKQMRAVGDDLKKEDMVLEM
ncbi:MAG: ABC transporter substrate-binding protein [Deltaproteobacteria bacterium]|nr:ABC transporter substrate-binding protein [Deltaproteobacteria bacterium]